MPVMVMTLAAFEAVIEELCVLASPFSRTEITDAVRRVIDGHPTVSAVEVRDAVIAAMDRALTFAPAVLSLPECVM